MNNFNIHTGNQKNFFRVKELFLFNGNKTKYSKSETFIKTVTNISLEIKRNCLPIIVVSIVSKQVEKILVKLFVKHVYNFDFCGFERCANFTNDHFGLSHGTQNMMADNSDL